MILYNVTVAVDESIHNQWLVWMKNEHIPEVMATGKFVDWKMYRILLENDKSISYSVQYFAQSMAQLQLYQAHHANELQTKHQQKFSDNTVAFRTILEEV